MTPRSVLHIRASRFVGGPERQILRYATLTELAGVTSTVATFIGDGEGEALLEAASAQATEVLRLPQGTISAYSKLVSFLKNTPQTLICTHGYKADILGILAARRTGTPVVSFLRGWTAEDAKVRMYEALNRGLLRFSDRIVCLSETQRSEMDGAGYRDKTRVVVNAAEPFTGDQAVARKWLRERLELPANATVIACAGRLSPEKGTSFFIEAARNLAAEFPQVHFVIFGDGALRSELAARCASQTNIHVAGYRRDFHDLVGGIDILVNPSLSEEMPNVVLEAMAAGVPVAATAVGGVPEIATAKPVIELIEPHSTDAIAQAVRRLLLDPAAAKRLGEAGQSRIRSGYSPQRQQQQLLALLEEFTPAGELAPLGTHPFISIVMPVRNEEAHILAVLKQLEDQDYPTDRYEVLVADGRSTDGTRQVVEEFGRSSRVASRWLDNPRQLSSAGRNVGVQASRGDVIAFIDGHCQIPSRTLLKDITELFQKTGAGCLCRPQPLHVEGNTRFQEALAHTRATIIGHGRDSTIFDMENERFVNPSSSGAIYRAEVFEKVGMYDERFDACEDVEFNFRVWKAGFTAFSSPRLAVYYSPRKSLGALWRQLMRYGRGRYRFMRKHADAVSVAQLIPAGFVFWLAFLACSTWFSPIAMWAMAGTIALYLVVTMGFAVRLSLRYGWHYLFISPAVYGCIHWGLGIGFWREALFGRKLSSRASEVRRFERPHSQRNNDQEPGVELTSATSNKR